MADRRRRVNRERRNPLTYFDEAEFRQRYRLPKASIEALADDYQQSRFCTTECTPQGGGITAAERFCLAVRYLATGSNYKDVGAFQGVTKGLVSHCVSEVTDYLNSIKGVHIRFPSTPQQQRANSRAFFHKYGRPGCVGFVDGTHVAVIAPQVNEPAFVNRKTYHSINVLLATDVDHFITHCDPRWAGATHDAHALRMSRLHDFADTGGLEGYYLLADSGYGVDSWLFPPVLNPNGAADIRYNQWHRQSRFQVEQTIGILKMRWRCLNDHGGFLYHSPKRAARIIMSCAVLHNVARRLGMADPQPEDDDGQDPDRFRACPRPREQPPPDAPVAQPMGAHRRARDEFILRQFAHRRVRDAPY